MTEFDTLLAGASARLDRIRALEADLAALRAEHTTADAAVTVAVDGSARLLDLQLSGEIARMRPDEFGRAVVEAAAAAAAQALRARAELIAEFNG